jgi:hypothetical protein
MAVQAWRILTQFSAFAATSQIWRNLPHNRGRATKLGCFGGLHQLDQSLENASEGFFQANRNFAQASRDIEAVQAGRQAATRGRSEDIIPAYQALRPEAQAAFRAGYIDPLIAQPQGTAFGVNKARPLTNDAFRDEAAAMAPGNALMQRRVGREMTLENSVSISLILEISCTVSVCQERAIENIFLLALGFRRFHPKRSKNKRSDWPSADVFSA